MTTEQRTSLGDALLRPASIAVIGASDDLAKPTARPFAFLRDAGFDGRVYPINPRRETVQGARAYARLADLPEVPDLAFIATATELVVDAVRECGEQGVRVACILAGGFGEDGEEGVRRRDELLATAREAGVRILGPNSMGIVNPRNGCFATANAVFAEQDVPRGGLFLASQSGSVIGGLMTRARTGGVGFAGLVSTGSEIDLTLGEICEATLDDPEITDYALFLESLENAESLARFARAAHARGKGVTAFKLGRSETAAELSATHTGALSGSDDESEAFFRSAGIVRVETLEALAESAGLSARVAPVAPGARPRVGVVTGTGGGAAILVDQLALRGADVVGPSAETRARIAEAGVEIHPSAIVDLTLAGTRHDKVLAVLEAMQESGEFDVIVFVIGSSARLHPELAVRAIAERADGPTPLVAWALPEAPRSRELLRTAGVPSFRTPEACADALVAVLHRREPVAAGPALRPVAGEQLETLDEEASSALMADLGVTLPGHWVLTDDDGADGIPDAAFPVVVKALTSSLPHKSDAGAVVLRVADRAGVQDAIAQIRSNVARHRPELVLDRFLVQQMITDGVGEMLIGYRLSPQVGPLVMLAAGGVNVELYRDSALRVAPVTRETAQEMVAEVRATRLLQGYRGGRVGDVDALVDAIVAVSSLAERAPEVREAEINPVLIRGEGEGVIAVDALVHRVARG